MNAIDVLDEIVLREVRAINLRGLGLLPPLAVPGAEVGLAGPLREIARAVSADPDGLGRLADQPFLLFDIGLDDPLRWHAARSPAVGDDPALAAGFPWSRESALFAGMMFHYAWYLARTSPLTAAVVAGMAPATAEVLRGLSLQQVDDLSRRSGHWLRLRWDDSPSLWAALLGTTGSAGGDQPLQAARLQALLHLAGAAIARRAAARSFGGQSPASL